NKFKQNKDKEYLCVLKVNNFFYESFIRCILIDNIVQLGASSTLSNLYFPRQKNHLQKNDERVAKSRCGFVWRIAQQCYCALFSGKSGEKYGGTSSKTTDDRCRNV